MDGLPDMLPKNHKQLKFEFHRLTKYFKEQYYDHELMNFLKSNNKTNSPTFKSNNIDGTSISRDSNAGSNRRSSNLTTTNRSRHMTRLPRFIGSNKNSSNLTLYTEEKVDMIYSRKISIRGFKADISGSMTNSRNCLLALVILSALSLLTPAVSAAEPANSITISFLDESGAVIGEPQIIPYAQCRDIDPSLLQSTDGLYASVVASELHAALNLYSSQSCQVPAGSAVGQWPNTGTVTNMTSIRWEGIAPADMVPGTLSPDSFPPQMAVQTQVPDPDADPVTWEMDPSKGRVVVGFVAGVLVIGVLIGIYQVYLAAQYVPPPKKPKKPTGLNTKKIKKKDAYFKKPVHGDQQAFQRLYNDSPEPYATHSSMTERGARDSQASEAATIVDWSQQQRSRNGHNGSDMVTIDMGETTSSHNTRPLPLQAHSRSSTLNLIQFDNDTQAASSGHNSNYNRGRGGEVLVPMNTFESNHQHSYQQQHGRTAIRRSSSSRSR
ncbi:hypothetical protein EDD21DRAFT_416191 [Dissophora ornata]|nr:hypothetical protein BGZ58_005823 [Dissophora ornata]KAI8600070.1 hypothetical protein EDD21DRAFT_416191 [Dissophora ornata]